MAPARVPGEKGRSRSKPGRVRALQASGCARAGLSPKLRFHDLRHTLTSHWVLDGGDIFRLSKILGHSNVTITQKTYAHLAPEAWEQDYHRVAFTVPGEGTVYGFTRRKSPRAGRVGTRSEGGGGRLHSAARGR